MKELVVEKIKNLIVLLEEKEVRKKLMQEKSYEKCNKISRFANQY